jgi:hypothetical protein
MRAEVPGSLIGLFVGTSNGPRPTLLGCPGTEPPLNQNDKLFTFAAAIALFHSI